MRRKTFCFSTHFATIFFELKCAILTSRKSFMIYTFFDNLRTKPKAVRDHYAFLGAVCCTLMIGGVWSLSIPARLGSFAQSASSTSVATVASAPHSGFFEQLKSQFKSVQKIGALPMATSTDSHTATATTEAALGLQLTPENRQAAKTNTSNIQFGTVTIASPTKAPDVSTSTPATTTTKSATTTSF